jgi:hypothetical protein
MRCKIQGLPNTISGTEAPISAAQSLPVTGLKEESTANFPSKPQEQKVSNQIESIPSTSIPPSVEAQSLNLPLKSQDPPRTLSTDTKTIPPSSAIPSVQKPISKQEVKPSSSELIVQNYEVRMLGTLVALSSLFLLS